jgi:hypothetical protein
MIDKQICPYKGQEHDQHQEKLRRKVEALSRKALVI